MFYDAKVRKKFEKQKFFIAILLIYRCIILVGMNDVNIALREWNLDVIVIEGFVNAFHYLSVVAILCQYVHPDENFQCDAIVIKTLQNDLYPTSVVNAVEFCYGVDEEFLALLYVCAVGYTHFKDVELETVILCKVLIVLREKL